MLYTENFGLQEYFRFLQIQSHMQITEICFRWPALNHGCCVHIHLEVHFVWTLIVIWLLVLDILPNCCFTKPLSKYRMIPIYVYRAWNSSRPLATFQPIFHIWLSKSNLLGQIYCTFPMGKPYYCNVPTFKEWLTYFKLLFQALVYHKTYLASLC